MVDLKALLDKPAVAPLAEIAQEVTEGTEGGINASRFLSALIRPAATFSPGEKGDNGAL